MITPRKAISYINIFIAKLLIEIVPLYKAVSYVIRVMTRLELGTSVTVYNI